jgi:hypothetical protein
VVVDLSPLYSYDHTIMGSVGDGGPALRPFSVGGRQKLRTVDGEGLSRAIRWVFAWNARRASGEEQAHPDRVLIRGGRGHGHNQHQGALLRHRGHDP